LAIQPKGRSLEKPSRLTHIPAMNITLTPEQEAWLRAEIAEGHFATPEDAIAHAINEARRASLCDTLNGSIARGGVNSAEDVRRAIADRLKTAP
jgi:hypothetical protein